MLYFRVSSYADFVAVANGLQDPEVLYTTDGAGSYYTEAVCSGSRAVVAPDYNRVGHPYFPGVTLTQVQTDFKDTLDTTAILGLSFSASVGLGTTPTPVNTSYLGITAAERLFGRPDAILYKVYTDGTQGVMYLVYLAKQLVVLAGLVSDTQGTLVPESQVLQDYPTAIALADLVVYAVTP